MTNNKEEKNRITEDNRDKDNDIVVSASDDDLKQHVSEIIKEARGLAGTLGRITKKKGMELKERLEDEDFQDNIKSNIKSVTDKIDEYVSSDSHKNRKTINVKGIATETPRETVHEIDNHKKTSGTVRKEELELSFEVEDKETIEFETKKPSKGLIANIQNNREEKKAAKARIKAEKERERRKKQKISMIASVILIALCVAMILIGGRGDDDHAGQVQPPFSAEALSGLNYEEVVAGFKEAGFTNVTSEKMEDLVVGLLSSDGEVERITIDGDDQYHSYTWYEPDVKVVVYYHTYPEENDKEEDINNKTTEDDNITTDEVDNKSDEELETDSDTSSSSGNAVGENQVMGIVLEYGQYNYDITFRIVLTEAAVESDGQGTGWNCWGKCRWKDEYRNNQYGTFRSHVTPSGVVDEFAIF